MRRATAVGAWAAVAVDGSDRRLRLERFNGGPATAGIGRKPGVQGTPPFCDSAADLAAALAAIAAAAADGAITADEALALSQTLVPMIDALAAREKERRREELVAYYGKSAIITLTKHIRSYIVELLGWSCRYDRPPQQPHFSRSRSGSRVA